MSNQLSHSNIPTTFPFGKKRGFTWNPVRGCNNFSCPLHPKNKGKCWAAQLCRFHAGPWAEAETHYVARNKSGTLNGETTFKIEKNLYNFKPTWFESQYDKEFPKQQSCIAVGYQADLAFVNQDWIYKILDKIIINNRERVAAGLPLHIFQFLTKAPEKLYPFFEWPGNCWLGVTIMNNFQFNNFIHQRFKCKCMDENLVYLYFEPLTENIDFRHWKPDNNEFKKKMWDWVIVGGGPDPINPDWVRSIRDQCLATGIPFFFKGWGKWIHESQLCEINERGKSVRTQYMDFSMYYRKNPVIKDSYLKLGKRWTKNILDGKMWEQFPEVKS